MWKQTPPPSSISKLVPSRTLPLQPFHPFPNPSPPALPGSAAPEVAAGQGSASPLRPTAHTEGPFGVPGPFVVPWAPHRNGIQVTRMKLPPSACRETGLAGARLQSAPRQTAGAEHPERFIVDSAQNPFSFMRRVPPARAHPQPLQPAGRKRYARKEICTDPSRF